MSTVVAIVLGLLALAFVLYPLYRPVISAKIALKQDGPLEPGTQAEGAVPEERELAARDALQEVELDFQLGNISETDYDVLRERYMRRAMVALKSRYDHEQELDELIEAQLQKMREQENDAKN